MRHTRKLLAMTATLALTALAGSAIADPPQPTIVRRTPPQVRPPGFMQHRNISIDGRFSFPMDRGCEYRADISGSARHAGTNPSGEPVYTASGVVSSAVNCPNRSTIRGSERLSTTTPATLPEIEQAIEQRGTLAADAGGQHCAYTPNFTLDGQRLRGVGAALSCPAQEPMRGGGPTNK